MLIPSTSTSFITLISDSLRLRHETLAMAFVYINKYLQYLRDEPAVQDLLDDHTLGLASLSLATKATESPRRLREFLLPAYALLNPASEPLTFPSALYDSLRGTLVAAEFILLRVLRFDIRLPLPFDYLPRFLEKMLTLDGTDHLDFLGDDEREEVCVVDVKDTTLGRGVWALVGEAVKSYRLVNLFPARTVAAACFFIVLEENGVKLPTTKEAWVKKLTGDRVEFEDFEEAVEEVRNLKR
ncbi:hypothetical protein K440DRAFT_594799 [Wilcoxina mikolae CBS 423.85]|nr:hypothetical protein K440DRAFT_594799 [Wilcoxina mikolae CBS 423.85]